MATDNRDMVNWMRERMGVGSDLIRHADSEEFERESKPIFGITGPNYRYRSPDFTLEARTSDNDLGDQATSLRFWHESRRGMGLVRLWHDVFHGGIAADVEVTPTPGTDLAELLGCDANADSCAAKRADLGALVIIPADARSPWSATVSRDFWNPRHDLAGASSDGL